MEGWDELVGVSELIRRHGDNEQAIAMMLGAELAVPPWDIDEEAALLSGMPTGMVHWYRWKWRYGVGWVGLWLRRGVVKATYVVIEGPEGRLRSLINVA